MYYRLYNKVIEKKMILSYFFYIEVRNNGVKRCVNVQMTTCIGKIKQICNEKVFVICNQINNLKKENG